MEDCVNLNSKTIVCMNWGPVTFLLRIAKVPNQQNDENQSDLAVDAASFNHVLETD